MKPSAGTGSVFLLCSLLLGSDVTAEESGWIRLYDGWRYATINSVRETRDGGIVIAGANGPTYHHDIDDAVIAKLDRSGNFVWKRIIGGHGSDSFQSVIETSHGDFLAVGRTRSAGYHPDGIWLVRVSAAGRIVWNRSYRGFGNAGSCTVRTPAAVFELPGGGFVLVTEKTLVRLDADGKALSVRSYPDPAFSIDSIVRIRDGGYLAAGGRACARLDGAGRIVWLKVFNDDCQLFGTAQAGDGSYLAVGSLLREGRETGVCLKLDSDGNVLWARSYGESCLRAISPFAGSRISLTGRVHAGRYSWEDWPWVLEIDDSGNILSQEMLQRHGVDFMEGGSFNIIAAGLDGSLLLGGGNWTFGYGVGTDGLLLKLPPPGGFLTCPGLLVDSSVSTEPLTLTAGDGDTTSVLSKGKWKTIKSFEMDWDAACNDPCQSGM